MSAQHQIPQEHWKAAYGLNTPYPAPSRVPWQTETKAYMHAGLITAAGASRRMGSPKALLRLPNGQTLAEHQSAFLKQAGCVEVVIVLGSDAERIAQTIRSCHSTVNDQWKKGRMTSVQAGLRALRNYDGCFIMPIDAAGIRPDTLRAVRETAETGDHDVVRPTHNGQPGYLVWISRIIAEQIVAFQGDSDTPLNQVLAPHTQHLPVNDPAILRNINTPDEWESARTGLTGHASA